MNLNILVRSHGHQNLAMKLCVPDKTTVFFTVASEVSAQLHVHYCSDTQPKRTKRKRPKRKKLIFGDPFLQNYRKNIKNCKSKRFLPSSHSFFRENLAIKVTNLFFDRISGDLRFLKDLTGSPN